LRMDRRFKILTTCIILSISFGTTMARAQVLHDPNTLNLIKDEIDCIYNLQFKKSQILYLKIQKLYPKHPVLFLLRGLQTYWENYPILTSTPVRASFEEDLRQCIQLSKKSTNPANEAEYLLNNLCARGMLLKFYDDNHLTMDVIPLATSSYKYLSNSFNFINESKDLQYYTGVYNYYREAYPNAYPVYKSLLFIFPHGNMKTGLKEIQNAAINAVVLRAESYFILSWIYLNFENNYLQALKYSNALHEMYPDNMVYIITYVKNLLLLKRYDEVEKLITISQKETENKYFQAQFIIFKGILQEKKYHDNNLAKQYYTLGISKISPFGGYGNEYAAYAYFGLSRISNTKNETSISKQLREKAMKLTSFKNISFDR